MSKKFFNVIYFVPEKSFRIVLLIISMDNEKKPIELKSNDLLTNYIKELDADVKLTQYNLREKSLTSSSIWAKWLSYLYKEKENL